MLCVQVKDAKFCCVPDLGRGEQVAKSRIIDSDSSQLAKHSAAARCMFLTRIEQPVVSNLDKSLEKLKDYREIERKWRFKALT